MILYVWSGSLRGVRVQADSDVEAVEQAVRQHLPCMLGQVIRVTPTPRGGSVTDVYFDHLEVPHEQRFPSLFSEDLDVEVGIVEPDPARRPRSRL